MSHCPLELCGLFCWLLDIVGQGEGSMRQAWGSCGAGVSAWAASLSRACSVGLMCLHMYVPRHLPPSCRYTAELKRPMSQVRLV